MGCIRLVALHNLHNIHTLYLHTMYVDYVGYVMLLNVYNLKMFIEGLLDYFFLCLGFKVKIICATKISFKKIMSTKSS